MKKILVLMGFFVLLAALAASVLSSLSPVDLAERFLRPEHPFNRPDAPRQPAYSSPLAWAALPDQADAADLSPQGIADGDAQASARADVFYIHPSSLYRTSTWNQRIDDETTNRITDYTIIAAQASIFNHCCRVYAPRYRQVSLGTFLETEYDATGAFELAYSDVARAFAYYYTKYNQGRPFIIASHSQGSMHAARLLEEIDATSARARLVAAYIPGFHLPMDKFGRSYRYLRPCQLPGDLGCIASWDTYDATGVPPKAGIHRQWYGNTLEAVDDRPSHCTNPLLWTIQEPLAAPEMHLGAVAPSRQVAGLRLLPILLARNRPSLQALPSPQAHGLSARCVKGRLIVSDLNLEGFDDFPIGPGNYHIYDFALFYMNVRQNAALRVEEWLKKYGTPTTGLEPAAPISTPNGTSLP